MSLFLGHQKVAPSKGAGKKENASKKASNWTLAFSTIVVPINKTNPLLTHDNGLRSEQSKKKATKKVIKTVASTAKISKKLNTKKTKTFVNTKKLHNKLRQKHEKRRSKSKSKNKSVQTSALKDVVNNSTRHTRDYPYSYYQYQYSPSDKSYQTQETDWRRDMVPSTVDSYAAYDNVDKQPLYQSQDDLASISDQMGVEGNNIETQGTNNGLFSLPIASLVRRTEIPGGPHHISSISIVNDMLPDDQNKGYLTDRDTIPILSPDNRAGYIASKVGTIQDKADTTSHNQYDLAAPLQYQTSQQSLDTANGRNIAAYSSDGSRYATGNYITNITGIPLSSFASMSPHVKSIPEDQSPTASPVMIGSDDSQAPLSQRKIKQNPPTNGNKPNISESAMEMDLTDPGHFPNSKEALAANMKKYANISLISNVLPAKEVPSVPDSSLSVSELPGVSNYASPSSAPGSTIATSTNQEAPSYKIGNPVNMLYSALNKVASIQSTLSTTPAATIFPTSSKSLENDASLVQEPTNIRQGDIDAPVQNAILPVGTKNEAYTESQSGDGQLTTDKDGNQNQNNQTVFGSTMDLPFPTRLRIPEPSQSASQILSGLSSAVYQGSFSNYPSYMSSVLDDQTSTIYAATYMTTKLTNLPTVTANFDMTNQAQTTAYDYSYKANTVFENPIAYTQNIAQQTVQLTSPDIVTASYVQPSSDRYTYGIAPDDNSPTASPRTIEKPMPLALNSTTDYNSESQPDSTTYNEVVVSDGNQTYEVTSDNTGSSLGDNTTSSSSITPTSSVLWPDLPSSEIVMYTPVQSVPSQGPGHFSPESRVSFDDSPKHISPVSEPKLRVSDNGSVIVLNHKTKRPDINQIYHQYQTQAKNKAKLKAKKLRWLTGKFPSKHCVRKIGENKSKYIQFLFSCYDNIV